MQYLKCININSWGWAEQKFSWNRNLILRQPQISSSDLAIVRFTVISFGTSAPYCEVWKGTLEDFCEFNGFREWNSVKNNILAYIWASYKMFTNQQLKSNQIENWYGKPHWEFFFVFLATSSSPSFRAMFFLVMVPQVFQILFLSWRSSRWCQKWGEVDYLFVFSIKITKHI